MTQRGARSRHCIASCVAALAFYGCSLHHGRNPPAGDAGARPVDAFVASTDAGLGADAGLESDAGLGSDAAPPDPRCPLDSANATIAGDTPLGAIHFQYAWAGLANHGHSCFDIALHASDVSAVEASGLARELRARAYISGERVGRHEGIPFELTLDGREATTDQGVVEITRYVEPESYGDPGSFEASIAIEGGGWNVHGTLVSPFCERFRDPCL